MKISSYDRQVVFHSGTRAGQVDYLGSANANLENIRTTLNNVFRPDHVERNARQAQDAFVLAPLVMDFGKPLAKLADATDFVTAPFKVAKDLSDAVVFWGLSVIE